MRITKAETAVYALNEAALQRSIVQALGLQACREPVDGLASTTRVGVYSPYAGFRFPVYLTVQVEAAEFQQAVEGLAARNERAFILLAPTRAFLKESHEDLLKRRKARFFALSDTLAIDGAGVLTGTQPLERFLSEFRESVLPAKEDRTATAFFPTPPDAGWDDVRINFLDAHTVSVNVRGEAGSYHYTEMSMANRKNAKPTVQWELLWAFAQEHGTLDWSSRHAGRKNQKRREKLAADLSRFFRIEGDPIVLTEDKKGWRTVFSVSRD